MRRVSWITLIYLVSAFLCAGVVPSPAAEGAKTVATGNSVDSVVAPSLRNLSADEWDAVNLGRAVDLWLKNDLRGAAALLEEIDVAPTATFDRADRAAFLLAVAYLRMGDGDAFSTVAQRAGAADGSVYRRWIRYYELLEFGRGGERSDRATLTAPDDFPGARVVSATLLIEAGRAEEALHLLSGSIPSGSLGSIHLYVRALASVSARHNPRKDLERLAKQTPTTQLEADLVATAILQLAIPLIESGGNATELLLRVPADSRHAPRAQHMLALIASEQGDTEQAQQIFARILTEYPMYEARRDMSLAIGSTRMENGEWADALPYFESAETDWLYEFESLDYFESGDVFNNIWSVWEQQRLWRDEIRLASDALFSELLEATAASLDLTNDPSVAPDKDLADHFWPANDRDGGRASWDRIDALARHYPLPAEWDALRVLQQRHARAISELERQDRVVFEREQELGRRLDYLYDGHSSAAVSATELAAAIARLETILTHVDAAVYQLEAVRDSALLDIARRTRDMTVELRQDMLFVQAVRHFHVDGPQKQRPEKFPDGVPSPAQLLDHEEALATELVDFLTLFAEHYPLVIARSFDEIWEPRITGDSRRIHSALLIELARARAISSELDSTIAWYENDPALVIARARRDELAAAVTALRDEEQKLRRDITFAVAARGREQLRQERESIDYHLADAAYELTVATATDTATSENSTLIIPLRRRAIARLDTFLTRYPQSIARGESRYRLADLSLMKARDDFRIKMAEFLGEAPSADDLEDRALAPFVDYGPAISLYDAILAEDTQFPHMDAVLFNLGMILSDDGQSRGVQLLAQLVERYPESPDAQEAWLRMGNDRFDREDYGGSVALFEEAVAGADPSFSAIALYKLGWANFEQDDFAGSADAFRRLIDLYNEHPDVARAMDLRDEAEEYMVHSLARSGGASAFASYFDGLGGRDYEDRILMSLGHLMRSLSLYGEAVDTDQLWLERYPLHYKSPAVADRLVETYKNWNKPELAREARLAQAARFLPGTPWYENNQDEALRAKGRKFAQGAYRETAGHYHKLARKNDDAADWWAALTNYELYLNHWTDADDAEVMHLMAGETATRLEQYSLSLDHYAVAARSDSAALALDATWQRVGVTDTWYRGTRAGEDANGSDSLATLLIAVGDEFTSRFPADERCPDIVWRQGNIAYAHGWFADAAARLALLTQLYPGDPRASQAIRMSGDAHYRRNEFEAAGAAYEQALMHAQTAGHDSIAAELQVTIPLCYYKHAESFIAADSSNGEKEAAPYFARVAQRWPNYEHAHLALYRAGLGYAANGSYADAAGAWEQLLSAYPNSEYARDSALQIAQVHEKSGNVQSAAAAFERFSRLHPDDDDAATALLHAVDLLADAGDEAGAEQMRSAFLQRFPNDTEVVMEIRGERAKRELARVTSGTSSLSALMAGASAAGASAAATSELKEYLALAMKNPEMASPIILAQVDYFTAEEAYPSYAAMRLTQPLPKSIEAKKEKLEEILALYDKCAKRGVSEYARGSAHRIGQALIEFGDALVASERPSDLGGDDLYAYDEVINEQAWEFYDRGEDVWAELLQQVGGASEDPGGWIAQTREALWPRLGQRFMYRPEVEYPLLAAKPPQAKK